MKRGFADWRLVVVACLGALLVAGLWLWSRNPAEKVKPQADTADAGSSRTNSANQRIRRERGTIRRDAKPARQPNPGNGGNAADRPNKTEPETTEEVSEPENAEDVLVEAFDGLTDEWREPVQSGVPMEAVEKFRQQFNRIPNDRKEECLHRALNLVPDENAMLLMGILLDKEQPAEYLELVFNDILNRGEDVKNPLLQLIYKDKEHPCWASTAWILDVTGATPGK